MKIENNIFTINTLNNEIHIEPYDIGSGTIILKNATELNILTCALQLAQLDNRSNSLAGYVENAPT